MIPCICRDDKNKPSSIPTDKWIVEKNKYHVTYVYAMDLQNGILGVVLKEIDLDPFNWKTADYARDDAHPGPKSHANLAKFALKKLVGKK